MKELRRKRRQAKAKIKPASASVDGWRKIERKMARYGITTPRRRRQAEETLDKFLRGETVGQVKSINASTVMAAVNAVIDRADPKVTRTENLNLNADISPVDLSRYLASGREAREDAREATIEVQGIAGAGEEG